MPNWPLSSPRVMEADQIRQKSEWERAAWEEAWLRTLEFPTRYVWRFTALSAVGLALPAVLLAESGVLLVLAGAAGGALFVWLVLFLWEWFRAPQRQRNAARAR